MCPQRRRRWGLTMSGFVGNKILGKAIDKPAHRLYNLKCILQNEYFRTPVLYIEVNLYAAKTEIYQR